jgi:hypothetical protein
MLILGLLTGCAIVPEGGVVSADFAGSYASGRQVQAVATSTPASDGEVRADVVEATPGQVEAATGWVVDGSASVAATLAAND